MKKNIILSIIISNYNKGKYLKRCLDSIVNQDLSNVEIIVLDDCSTDDSVTILKEYKNLNLIKNEVNRGVCETRNIGLDISKGEYIIFIDSDDYVTNDYIYNIKLALNNKKDLYIFDVRKYIGEQIRKEYICQEHGLIRLKEYIKKNPKEYLKAHISYWVWNKVFKKSIVEKINLKFKNINCEDEEFCSKYFLNIEEIYFMNKYLYNYCINETSMSKKNDILYATPFKIVSTNNFNIFLKYNGDLDILENEIIKMFNVGYDLSNDENDKKQLLKNKDELIKNIYKGVNYGKYFFK